MSLAFIKTRSTVGIRAQSVAVEVHLSPGLPAFTIVGLPQVAVRESKDRVRSAIINSQFEFPCRKITINLSPADLPKSGCGFDLPIAIGILAASAQIPLLKLESHEFIGELALCGNIQGVNAIIPAVMAARNDKKTLIIAKSNADEAGITEYNQVFTAHNLREVCSYLCGQISLPTPPPYPKSLINETTLDWSDVKGQFHAKKALVIAAAGGHSILLSGPPGSGKTMLAKRFNTLLPELNEEEALECAAISSVLGKKIRFNEWRNPPFRAPHHTASSPALVGGGNPPKPGEISLAHRGILFLDELPEFSKQVLETLREPLESGNICISRAANQMDFPASFQLIAAMNPCPCGQWGNPKASCFCSPDKINRYLGKLSGPLLDRIDMHIQLQALSEDELVKPNLGQGSESLIIREQVRKTRALQIARQGVINTQLTTQACEKFCALGEKERTFIMAALVKLKLSGRAYHRLLKVARTIADLNEQSTVDLSALQQALSFKQLLKKAG